MRVFIVLILFVFNSSPMQAQRLQLGIGLNMPYTTIYEPVYQGHNLFGYFHSNPCMGVRYQIPKNGLVHSWGIDIMRSYILIDLPNAGTIRYTTGTLLTLDYHIGKNLIHENKSFYFIPKLGLGLQYNYSNYVFWGFGILIDPRYYGYIDYTGINRNLIQPVLDLGFEFGWESKKARSFGVEVKGKYAHFWTSQSTFEYYALWSPEPNLARKAEFGTTGTGLEIIFNYGFLLKSKKKKSQKEKFERDIVPTPIK